MMETSITKESPCELPKLKTDKRDEIPTGKVVYVNSLIARKHSIGYVQINGEHIFNLSITQEVTITTTWQQQRR